METTMDQQPAETKRERQRITRLAAECGVAQAHMRAYLNNKRQAAPWIKRVIAADQERTRA